MSMREGDLDVTVFQDAFGQGNASIEVALKLAKGEQRTYVPFELVTPAAMEK